jgi:uncharacterized phage-associated protein
MNKTFNKIKYENVLLYILKNCSAKPSFGRTVLYKLLYFSDFNFYELYEKPLTGETYRRIDHGPAPTHITEVLTSLKKQNKVRHIRINYFGHVQDKYIPAVDPDLSKLMAEEIKTIDEVISKLSDMNATQISEYSHEDIPFKSSSEREKIDYELVFYRTPAYTVRQYAPNNAIL